MPFRFALRELRAGARGFGVFLACIALGVATIAGVGSVARGMTEGIAREGRVILGGDIAFTLVQRQATPAERAYLDTLGDVSAVATLRGMARRADDTNQALVEVKAIDGAYPLFGNLAAESGGGAEMLRDRGALAAAELLVRLDLKVGDAVELGESEFIIRGVLASEPDRLAGGLAFGPRLMIDQASLEGTGLVLPGSLVNWHYRVRLPGEPDDRAVAAVAERAADAFPQAAWQVRMRDDAAPGLRRNIERFAQFLTLIGLTALVVGGVGVANAVASFLDGKRDVIATLKCLGAPSGRAIAVYFIEIGILAVLGIAIGLVIGAILPFAAEVALRDLVPVAIAGLHPGELALAAVYGLIAALAFALYPLGRAREVSPTALFRDQVAPARNRPRASYLVAVAVAGAALAALAIATAFDQRIAIIFVVAAAGAFLLLRLVAAAIMFLARHAPRIRSTALRLAVGNIHRPGALTPSVVLSLGLGLTLLVALVLIDGNFRRELIDSIPKNAPSFFFLDVHNTDLEPFKALIADKAPEAKLDLQPNLRGRIVALNGVPSDQVEADPDTRWVLEGDRGITYAATQPERATLTDGDWWPADYDGPPLVSVDARLREGLRLNVGDTVRVNVLGRELTATIANFRTVDWQTLNINTVMVFSPNTFRGAPFASIATVSFEDGGSTERELALLKAVTTALPAVTVIRVKEAIDEVNAIVGQIGWAVRGASSITLIASVLVLGGAFAAGRRQRIYDAVILKTLGATRGRLLGAFTLEFLLLGIATAVFGLIAGSIAAWFVVTEVMEMSFALLPGPALGAAAVALALTLGFGLAGTWRVLGQKAAPVLRNL